MYNGSRVYTECTVGIGCWRMVFTGSTVGVWYLHGVQWEQDVYRVYSRSRCLHTVQWE